MQMEKIESALDGREVENPTAVEKTQCNFGKWLYSDEKHLRNILGSLFYNNIEALHGKWHNEYGLVFGVLFKTQKKVGMFAKMVGLGKASDMDIDKAKLYYSELKKTTDELLKAIAVAERRVSALQESKFH